MQSYNRIRQSQYFLLCTGIALLFTIFFTPKELFGQDKICPNDDYPAASVYPHTIDPATGNKVFTWFSSSPKIIFNAHTGKLYWFDPSNNGHEYTLLQSTTFVPPTSIRERVYVQVCGLHFASQVLATPNLQTISDAEPELYTGPAAPVINATAAPPTVPNYSLGTPGKNKTKPISSAAKCDAATQAKISKDATDLEQKIRAFDDAVKQYGDENHAFGMIASGPLSIAHLDDQIKGITTRAGQVGNNVTLFNAVMVDTQNASVAASALAASLAAASAQKRWSAVLNAGNDLDKSALTWKQDQDADVTGCTELAKQVAKTNDDLTRERGIETTTYTLVKNLFDDFNRLSDDLDTLFEADNDAYANSSVNSLSLLTVPTGNSVVTLTITVKDTFVPYTIAKSTPSPLDSTTGNPTPTTTSIKIDRTTKNVTSITVQAPASTAITLPDNPSATSQAANIQITTAAPSGTSTTTTTASAAPASTTSMSSSTSATAASGTTTSTSSSATSPAATSPGSTNVTTGSSPSPDATVIMERHHVINFVATGGLLVQTKHAPDYSVETVPTAIVTTTTTTVTPPGQGAFPTTTISVAQSTGTANYAFLADNPNLHFGALIGVTWFPGGIDTFGTRSLRKNGQIRMTNFDFSSRNFGMFVGTTVNTAGTFVIAPTYQITPGIELYVGLSNFSKTQLNQGVVLCSSLGAGSTTSMTQTLPNQQDASGNITATTIVTATSSPCNTPTAIPLNSATAVPTGSTNQFAPAFGILLNTNLFAALGLTH